MIGQLDPIEVLAYTELPVSCQQQGCVNLFDKSLEDPATDPVDLWSSTMATLARNAGWKVDSSNRVLCPEHARALDRSEGREAE